MQESLTIEKLWQLLKQSPKEIIIVDVRSPEEYAEKHIAGAINIPLDEIHTRHNILSKSDLIITACGKGGGRSAEAAEKLRKLGFTKAIYLCGGTFGWYGT